MTYPMGYMILILVKQQEDAKKDNEQMKEKATENEIENNQTKHWNVQRIKNVQFQIGNGTNFFYCICCYSLVNNFIQNNGIFVAHIYFFAPRFVHGWQQYARIFLHSIFNQ